MDWETQFYTSLGIELLLIVIPILRVGHIFNCVSRKSIDVAHFNQSTCCDECCVKLSKTFFDFAPIPSLQGLLIDSDGISLTQPKFPWAS